MLLQLLLLSFTLNSITATHLSLTYAHVNDTRVCVGTLDSYLILENLLREISVCLDCLIDISILIGGDMNVNLDEHDPALVIIRRFMSAMSYSIIMIHIMLHFYS